MLRIRNNGTIHEIKIPSDKLEVMQKILKSNVTESVKQSIIKKLSGGVCTICRGIPTREVIYDVDKATRIERYCENCVKTVYAREAIF
jgi:hypothetical protein